MAVNQDKTLWFLCGESVAAAPNEVTLTVTGAEPSKRFIREITAGADWVTFPQSMMGNRIISESNNVKLRSKKASAAKEDISMNVIYRNTDFVTHKVTVLAPHDLRAAGESHAPAKISNNACTRA